MSRCLLLVFLLTSSFALAQQPQPTQDNRSLAERAASARKKTSSETGATANQPQAKGANCDYKNATFGLEIKCLDGWVGVSRGDLNVIKAVTQTKQTIEFGMRSQDGTNVVVSLEPALYRKDLSNMKAALMEDTKAQLAAIAGNVPNFNPDVSDDPLLLGDPIHQFVAVRFKGAAIMQSLQLVPVNGTAVGITITVPSNSEDQLKDAINQLRTHMFWTPISTSPAQ